MAEQVNSSPTPEAGAPAPGPGTDRRRIAAVLLIIAAVAAIVVAVALGSGSKKPDTPHPDDDWYDGGTTLIDRSGMTDEEVEAELNRIIRENEMNVSVSAIIRVDAETGVAEVGVRNIEPNHVDQKFTLRLADGTVLYESGGVAPGDELLAVQLDDWPEPGTYDATITFQGYTPETHAENGGTASFDVQLVVEGEGAAPAGEQPAEEQPADAPAE